MFWFFLFKGKADTSRKELEDGLQMAKRNESVMRKVAGVNIQLCILCFYSLSHSMHSY